MALNEENIRILIEAVARVYESDLIELVLKRLDSFGYTPSEEDVFCIGFSVQLVENSIKNDCNVTEIPEGLVSIAVNMACGEVLSSLYRAGRLSIENLELDGAIASVKAGDISVSFNNSTSDDGKFTTLLTLLQNSGRGDFACYRTLRW